MGSSASRSERVKCAAWAPVLQHHYSSGVYLVCFIGLIGVCLFGGGGVFCWGRIFGFGLVVFFKIIVNAQNFSVDTALGSPPFTGKGPLSLRTASKFLSL